MTDKPLLTALPAAYIKREPRAWSRRYAFAPKHCTCVDCPPCHDERCSTCGTPTCTVWHGVNA